VEDGLRKLSDYLSAWAAFDAWCASRLQGRERRVAAACYGEATARLRSSRGAERA
jgi:hypothetical protein